MIWASWRRFRYDRKCLFSCIYNPQITVSPTSSFTVSFNKNSDFIHKRCQTRIFCLLKLRSLNINAAVLHTFYRCCIESVLNIFVSVLVWRLEYEKQECLNKVVKVCGKVVGERQEHLSKLYECRVVRKVGVIVDDNSHVLAKYYEILLSGRRFRVPKQWEQNRHFYISQ